MIGYCAEHKDQRKDAFLAASVTDCPYCRIAELEQQLSRYQGAVEVEGILNFNLDSRKWEFVSWDVINGRLLDYDNKKVRVLVMKEVE